MGNNLLTKISGLPTENGTSDEVPTFYNIHLTPSLKKGVETMCNLSEGLVEEGIQQGINDERLRQEQKQTAYEEKCVLSMLHDKIDASFIAKYSPISLERIQELGKANGLL